jgi:hypothetical protein
MGYPPPPDAPSLPEQAAIGASLSFEPSPSGLAICGFQLPGFNFNLSFRIPLPSFDFPPIFFFGLALKCDLSDPISANAGFQGRSGQPIVQFDEYENGV